MSNILGLDTACDLTLAAPALKASGYEWVGRYVIRPEDTHLAGKALTKPEAQAISAAGLQIVSIYETNPTHAGYFTYEQGLADARNALDAGEVGGIAMLAPIYFTVDCDIAPEMVTRYFEAVNNRIGIRSMVGVYGSGAVCQALLDAGLVTYTWLAQSTGWAGYDAFKSKATIIQLSQQAIHGIIADGDMAHVPDYGGWSLPPSPTKEEDL